MMAAETKRRRVGATTEESGDAIVRLKLGTGEHVYEEIPGEWGQLPEGWAFGDVADVCVGPDDRLFALSRGEHCVCVFEADGKFVTSWGGGTLRRPHGATLSPDRTKLYLADDRGHCIRVCSFSGEILATIGTPDQPSPLFGGHPFNQPTKVAFAPGTHEIYVADGYGNARVHKYNPDGTHLRSWGDSGCDPGQFNIVHSVCTDRHGRVFVADREIFDSDGKFLEQWNNMHRPCNCEVYNDRVYVGCIPSHLEINARFPNLGACVDIYDMQGNRLSRLGDRNWGEGPGQFIAPHGIAVDSRGDVYVSEVSWAAWGRKESPPRTDLRCLRKLVKHRP